MMFLNSIEYVKKKKDWTPFAPKMPTPVNRARFRPAPNKASVYAQSKSMSTNTSERLRVRLCGIFWFREPKQFMKRE